MWLLITAIEAIFGLIISIILAFFVAIVMDLFPVVKRTIYPFLVISQTIPVIALAPLLILWFGFGLLPKIITVVMVCFFPIAVNLYQGFASTDVDIINLLKSMGASRFKIISMVKIPSSLTAFFAGLKVAATYSVMGAVIGEWLSGDGGLGYYMLFAKHSYAVDKVFSAIIVIVALSLVLFKMSDVLQRIMVPWQISTNNKLK